MSSRVKKTRCVIVWFVSILSCFGVCPFSLYKLPMTRFDSFQETVLTKRAKLFIYGETLLDTGTGKKTWRERGVGDVRILRHKEHQRLRILMRQEKTMKVIANHALDPRIQLQANVGSDRSWVWTAFDYAEGELEETVFAIRFADSDVANEFKEKFIECQKEMEALLAGEDKPDEDGTAEEAAEALGALKTGDDEAKAEE